MPFLDPNWPFQTPKRGGTPPKIIKNGQKLQKIAKNCKKLQKIAKNQ